jgi:aspartate/methionine/tyrosine aminotransferase
VAAHALLRATLSDFFARPPQDWAFVTNAWGKPRIDANDGSGRLCFNLSHTRGHVAVAEALAVETGLLCLPGPFFGPGQARHLRLAFANAEPARIAEIPGRLQATRLATSSSV